MQTPTNGELHEGELVDSGRLTVSSLITLFLITEVTHDNIKKKTSI